MQAGTRAVQLKRMQTIAGTCLAYSAEAVGVDTPDGSCFVDVSRW